MTIKGAEKWVAMIAGLYAGEILNAREVIAVVKERISLVSQYPEDEPALVILKKTCDDWAEIFKKERRDILAEHS